MITTEAWTLSEGESELRLESFSFADIEADEVLVEPLIGCWEANMTHALQRDPVDICRQRREKTIVLGNAGIVRVLRVGSDVTTCREGDVCGLVPIGVSDETGATLKVLAYDAPRTMGVLAKRAKLREDQVIPVPEHSRYGLERWAAFNLRYCSAWSNWKRAHGCWLACNEPPDGRRPHVWGWGGGVTLAELDLAGRMGFAPGMISSNERRLALIEAMGIQPINRRSFIDMQFEPDRYTEDRPYRAAYLVAERKFMEQVEELTGGEGVSIFIDNIGTPVHRPTLKALARHGVVATCGWKEGYDVSMNRAAECIRQHVHVHTHGCRRSEGFEAVRFAEEHGWMPPDDSPVYPWEGLPSLAEDYAEG